MSHVLKQKSVRIKDLTCMIAAGDRRGLVFHQAATSFKSYGSQKPKCQGKFSVENNPIAYEMGIQRESDGTYTLLYDPYMGVQGLIDAIGKDAVNFRDEYNGPCLCRRSAGKVSGVTDRYKRTGQYSS